MAVVLVVVGVLLGVVCLAVGVSLSAAGGALSVVLICAGLLVPEERMVWRRGKADRQDPPTG